MLTHSATYSSPAGSASFEYVGYAIDESTNVQTALSSADCYSIRQGYDPANTQPVFINCRLRVVVNIGCETGTWDSSAHTVYFVSQNCGARCTAINTNDQSANDFCYGLGEASGTLVMGTAADYCTTEAMVVNDAGGICTACVPVPSNALSGDVTCSACVQPATPAHQVVTSTSYGSAMPPTGGVYTFTTQ